MQAPDPESADEKEVYAFFGLAAYSAQVAERTLIHLALLLRLKSGKVAITTTYDREYNAFARQTFGTILKKLSEDQVLEKDLRALLKKALKIRNRLTHHFFWENAEEFLSEVGRQKMIRELQEATNLLMKVEDCVVKVVDKISSDLGIKRQDIDKTYEELLVNAKQRYDNE